jgi:hypothetical protein
METIISLGYILSHYNQKGGANVCIVLGKWRHLRIEIKNLVVVVKGIK